MEDNPQIHQKNQPLNTKPSVIRKKITLVVGILIGTITIGLVSNDNPQPVNTGEVLAETIEVSMPTEINDNFLTQVNDCFLPITSLYGYTLRISSGFRTLEEQNQLFEQGRTVDGHIVTDAPAGRSIHNYGYAVDVVDRFRGFDINWERLGTIAEFCSINQGDEGDWAHFEHRGGLTTLDMEAGMRPPLLTLPCEIMAVRSANKEKLTMKDLQNCGIPKF